MATTQAVYYRDRRGIEPVDAFIETLPVKRAAKIDAYVEEHLNGQAPDAPPPAFPGNLVVLLHAFEKDTGAVPASEIAVAKHRMADFKRRMNARPRVTPRAGGRDAPSSSRSRH